MKKNLKAVPAHKIQICEGEKKLCEGELIFRLRIIRFQIVYSPKSCTTFQKSWRRICKSCSTFVPFSSGRKFIRELHRKHLIIKKSEVYEEVFKVYPSSPSFSISSKDSPVDFWMISGETPKDFIFRAVEKLLTCVLYKSYSATLNWLIVPVSEENTVPTLKSLRASAS